MPVNLTLQRCNDGDGIKQTLYNYQAVWHKSCRNTYNKTKIAQLKKRAADESIESNSETLQETSKRTRSAYDVTSVILNRDDICFFCDEKGRAKTIRNIQTFAVDTHVRHCTLHLGDAALITKLRA